MTQSHSRWLAGLLLISVLTNIVLAVKLQFPFAWQQLRLALIPAPQLTAADHVRGPADAATTIIIYTNYQCSFCARLNADLIKLSSELDFRWTYRHYTDESQEAFKAATAAECAYDQGKFWEYNDQLFAATQTWDAASLQQIAEQLKLDMPVFIQCTGEEKYKEQLIASRQHAVENQKINATPTYFINGKRYKGLKPYAELRKLMLGS
jgi:protein-disulfide isomerase